MPKLGMIFLILGFAQHGQQHGHQHGQQHVEHYVQHFVTHPQRGGRLRPPLCIFFINSAHNALYAADHAAGHVAGHAVQTMYQRSCIQIWACPSHVFKIPMSSIVLAFMQIQHLVVLDICS